MAIKVDSIKHLSDKCDMPNNSGSTSNPSR